MTGPHMALIKSSRGRLPQVVIGGRCFVIPVMQELNRLSLHLRTVIVSSVNAITKNRINMRVVSCCQVKVRAWVSDGKGGAKVDDASVLLAAQHFIGRTDAQIEATVHDSLEGHQRAIVAELTVEELYASRASFVEQVRAIAEPDLAGMGISMVSYVVQTLSDDSYYIKSLGAESIAKTKRAANEAKATRGAAADAFVASANVDADEVRAHECERMIEAKRACIVRRQVAGTAVTRAQTKAKTAFLIEDERQRRELLKHTQRAYAAEERAVLPVEAAILKRERLRQQAVRKVRNDAALYMCCVEAEIEKIRAAAEADRIRVIGKAKADTIECVYEIEAEILERRVTILNKV